MFTSSYPAQTRTRRALRSLGLIILLAPYIALAALFTTVWVDRTYNDFMLQRCNEVEVITQKDIDLIRRIQLLPIDKNGKEK